MCNSQSPYHSQLIQDLLVIGNQSRPKIFDLNIRRPSVLYSEVVEVDERVTLVGYTSDPQTAEHAVQFDEQGKVARGYRGPGWDGEGDAEGPGEIVKGLSGEAVRILKKPGESSCCKKAILYSDELQTRSKFARISKSIMITVSDLLPSSSSTPTRFLSMNR